MKNKLFKSGFCEKLKLLLIPIGLLIGSLTSQMWASESLGRVDMVYDFNGTEHTYAYYGSDNKLSNPRLNLGDLTTGTFTIKKLYWHCYDNWTTQSIDAFGWYNIGNGDTKIGEFLGYTGSNSDTDDKTDHEIKNEGVSSLIATANTGNSGTFTFSHWFIANFNYSGGQTPTYCSNGGDNYNFTFNILPPNASAITATPSGHISGSGTEDDPYIIPVGGDFSVSLSGSTKVRNDDNSAVQYSVDGGGTWGVTSEYTSKTFSNVTATDLQNYVFKSRCYNSDANLESPTITEKTIYYKTAPWSIAGTMNSWNVNNQPIAHYSSGTGYAEIALEANNTYTFKVKNRTNEEWYGQENADGIMTYTSDNNNPWQFTTPGNDCKITTAGAGTYRFTWNSNDKKLTVTYPTSYTVTFGYGDHGTTVTASGSTSGSIESGKYVTSGEDVTFTETHESGYSLKGWYTTSDGSTAVSGMSSGDNTLNSIAANANVYAQYIEDTYTVTVQYKFGSTSLHADGEVTGVGITTTQEAEAIDIEGYDFSEWSTLPSSIQTSDELTESSITINATADATIVANYTPSVYNGDLKGVDVSDGTYRVVYGATSLTVTSAPSKTGFHPYAYYLTYNDKTKDYSNPIAYASETSSKELVKGVSISTTDYTDANGKWKFEGGPDIFVKWEANTYIVTLHQNYGSDATSEHTIAMGDNFSRFSPTISKPTRVGYEFAGYYLSSGGDAVITANMGIPASDYFDSYANWKFDGNIDLYAHWTPVELTFNGTTDSDWSTAANWEPACVPTSAHDVTISAEATVSGPAVANSVAFGDGGKLTITSTGALEVAGTITNTDEDKLVVKPRGALIYDGSTSATAELLLTGDWQLIAIPVWAVDVSRAFAGSGVYTYVWDNSEKSWERRGYYDGLGGFEPILVLGSSGYNFSGTLVGSSDKNLGVNYDNTKATSGNVSMFGNSWTAPIKLANVVFEGNIEHAVHFLNSGGSWTGEISSGVIPAMQGFAVLSTGTGGGTVSIEYDRDVRNATSPNAPLYAPKRNASNIYDHITIYVSGNEWNHRIRLYENEQFTNDIDNGFEAVHMEGEGIAGELYAQAAEKMNILAVPDLEGTVVGFIPGEATNYTISFEGDGRGYYLNDIEEQQSTLIEEGNTYTFSSGNNNAARFIVSRTPINHMPTGVDEVRGGVKARKQMIDGVLYIVRDGRMYNAEGALVK